MNYLIYKYTGPSGKSYIGQTKNHIRRISEHTSKRNRCRVFHAAIKKYGWDNFTCEILAENLTLETANKLEESYITEHQTIAPNGYNLREGGNNHLVSDDVKAYLKKIRNTPEYISKMKLAMKIAQSRPEVRIKRSLSLRKAFSDPEYRRRLSDRTKLQWSDPTIKAKAIKTGKATKACPEYRLKMSETQKIAQNTEQAKRKTGESNKIAHARPETKARMRLAALEVQNRPSTKLAHATNRAIRYGKPFSYVPWLKL
jgi:group I intron endonuclease